METSLYVNAFLLLIFVVILGLLSYCYYAETFKIEKMSVDGKIIEISEPDYYYNDIPASFSYNSNGFENYFYNYQISQLPTFSTEMVNVHVKVINYIGNIEIVKFDMKRSLFEQMNLELNRNVSLNCYKMKFQKKFTFDQQ